MLRGLGPLLRRLPTGGSILCFHGVTSPTLPSAGLAHVPAARLGQILSLAQSLGEFVPLSELVQRMTQGRLTNGLVAITCDDAYASLMTVAGVHLMGHRVPMTVFVVTDAAECGDSFWWDRVDDVFARTPRDRWRQFEDECGLPQAYRDGQPASFGPLRPLRQWVLRHYLGRTTKQLEKSLAALEADIGLRTNQRSMTFDELQRLCEAGWVELGPHTKSHAVLPLLSDEEAIEEISGSHDTLRARFDRVTPMLAVPFGLYDGRTSELARRAGMQGILTLGSVTLKHQRPPHGLPRISVMRGAGDWKIFLRLSGVIDALRPAAQKFPDLPSAKT